MSVALHKIGKRIREIRKAKGYSQAFLGEQCGFTFAYIGGIERSENNVSIKNLEKIANALDVDLFEFFIDYKDAKSVAQKENQLSGLIDLLLSLDVKELKKARTILDEVFKKK